MKNFLIFTFFVVLCSGKLFSQSPIRQGHFILNGSCVLSTMWGDAYGIKSKNELGEVTNTENSYVGLVNSSVGYFLFDGLAIGGNLNFLYGNIKNGDGSKEGSLVSLGIFTSYYMNVQTEDEKIPGNVYPFVSVSYLKSFGISSIKSDLIGSLAFGPGLMVMITNSVGLNIELKYQIDSFKNFDDGKRIQFLVGLSANL